MCAEKFPLVLMGGRAEGLACADPGAKTPIGASGIAIIVPMEIIASFFRIATIIIIVTIAIIA